MKRLFTPAIVLLLLLNDATGLAQENNLQLTPSIMNQRYCAVNGNVDALQLTLSLRYTNTGRGKLILYKGNRLFYQMFISRSGEEAAARRNELRTTHSRYFDEQPEKIVASAPGRVFTILSPGDSYETRQIISVPVTRDGGKGIYNVSIGAGEHVLSVTSSTWYESQKIAQQLRERWRSRGFLWTNPLVSNSINFVVDENRAPIVCQ
ncbi:MAG: hypothetical protein H0U54_12765 [Acidobacteria bacterium]|jgi:hypothetical protein|nr:hypothetical protein [Acidobacteriota bacterium]